MTFNPGRLPGKQRPKKKAAATLPPKRKRVRLPKIPARDVRRRATSLVLEAMSAKAAAEIPLVVLENGSSHRDHRDPDDGSGQPPQLFGWPWPRPIRVPLAVHPCGHAVIVGSEYRDVHQGEPGWIYYIRFTDGIGGEWWKATEAEVVKWQAGE